MQETAILEREHTLINTFVRANIRGFSRIFLFALTTFIGGFSLYAVATGFYTGLAIAFGIGICDLIFWFCFHALRHPDVVPRLYTHRLFLFAMDATLLIFLLGWSLFRHAFDGMTIAQFAPMVFAVVITGELGSRRQTIWTAVVFSLVILLLALLQPKQSLDQENLIFILLTSITTQWAVAAKAVFSGSQYDHLIRDQARIMVERDEVLQTSNIRLFMIALFNHNFRGPLFLMELAIDILDDYILPYQDQIPEDLRLAVLKLHTALESMRATLDAMVRARAAEGEIAVTITPTNVFDVIQQGWLMVEHRFSDGHTLQRGTIDPHLTIQADTGLLSTTLMNLMSNACKYGGADQLVIVEVTHTDTMAQLRIRDHGKGIPPEQQGVLFQQFVRLKRDIDSKVPGLGVGLFISRQHIQAMGGTLVIEQSVPGEGSTFTVTLPLSYESIPSQFWQE